MNPLLSPYTAYTHIYITAKWSILQKTPCWILTWNKVPPSHCFLQNSNQNNHREYLLYWRRPLMPDFLRYTPNTPSAREEEPHCDPFSNISLFALVLPSVEMWNTVGLSDGLAESPGMTQQEKESITTRLIASPQTNKPLLDTHEQRQFFCNRRRVRLIFRHSRHGVRVEQTVRPCAGTIAWEKAFPVVCGFFWSSQPGTVSQNGCKLGNML